MGNIKTDWTSLHKYAPSSCYCRCAEWPGAPFFSHAKYVPELKRVVSELPCPKCGQNDSFYSIRSEPVNFKI